MTLTELRDEVYILTNRPDLEALTLSAIRSTTLRLHQSEYYYKDFRESGVNLGADEFIHSWEYRNLIPNWRAFKYFRRSDISGNPDIPPFEIVETEAALDAYKQPRLDVCYVAGDNLQIRSRVSFQYAFAGWYENPDVTQAGYSSWIARDHPFAIINGAAAAVFRAIGKKEEYAIFKGMEMEQKAAIDISNILGKGY